MSIELAEDLKKQFTDQYVVVADDVPELKRFSGLTGQVKTVNMSGRALVQFLDSIDISWYDIDTGFLQVVDKPEPKAKGAAKKDAGGTKAAKKTAVGKAGLSPLEMARQQDKGGGGAKPAAKKMSPLEMARQQDTGRGTKPVAEPKAEEPAPVKPKADGKKLSPLERARMQDGGGASAQSTSEETSTETENAEKPAVEELAVEETTARKNVPTTDPDGKKLSPLELARLQDGNKG